MTRSWVGSLFTSRARRSSVSRRRVQDRRRRFTLESLEDRVVLSTFTWNGATNASWTDTSNWVVTNGASHAGGPNASDDVVFDASNSNSTSSPASASTIKSLTVSGYTGTLSLGGDLKSTNGFSQTSGTIDANAATFTVSKAFTISGGTFNADTGTVVFSSGGSSIVNAPGVAFNNVTIATNGDHIFLNANLDVNGTLDLKGFNQFINNGGNIYASGDVTTSAGGAHVNTSTGTIVIDGTGAQSMTGDTVLGGYLPNINVSKSASSTLSLFGSFNVQGNWTNTSGKIAAGTSTVTFLKGTIDTGSQSFNNVDFTAGTNHIFVKKLDVNGNLTINSVQGVYFTGGATSGALTVAGDLTSNDSSVIGNADIWMDGTTSANITGLDFPNGGIVINKGSTPGVTAAVTQALDGPLVIQSTGFLDGTFNVGKNVTTHDTSVGTGTVAGDGLVFSGTGPQTLKAAVLNGEVPNVTINKPGGTLTVATDNPVRVSGNWTLVNGAVNTAGSTVVFHGTSKTVTAVGMTFNNVTLDMGASQVLNVGAGITVVGDLTITSTGVSSITGDISVQGNVTTSDTFVGGAGTIIFNGTGPQTLKADVPNGSVPGVKINKPSDTLTVSNANAVRVTGDWTYVSGGVDTTGSTVVFYSAAPKTVTAGGKSFNNVTLDMGSSQALSLGAGITVDGDLLITSAGVSTITGDINVKGNVTSNDTSVGGTGTIVMNGATNANITGLDFPNGGVIIQKGNSHGVTAAVTQALDGPLEIKSTAYLDGTFWVGKDVITSDTGVGVGTVAGDGLVFKGTGSQTLKADVDKGQVPNVKIDKPSGTLTVATAHPVSVSGDWIWVNGDVNTANSKVVFYRGSSGTKTVDDGGEGFNDVEVVMANTTTLAVTNMTVGGDLTITNVGSITGTINAKGNVISKATGAGGPGTIIFNGTGPQTLKADVPNGSVPNVKIDKPSGTLTVSDANTVRVLGDWTWVNGDVNTANSKVVFYRGSSGTKTVDDGGEGFNDVEVVMANTTTLAVTNMTVGGDLTITNVGSITGTINAQGNVTSNDSGVGGSGVIVMNGTNAATISGLDFPNGGIVIDKPVGTAVSLGSNLSNVSAVDVQSGTLNLVGYTLGVNGPMTVDADGTLAFAVSAAVTQLTVNGDLTFNNGSRLTITDGGLTSGSNYTMVSVTGGNDLIQFVGSPIVTAPGDFTVTVTSGANGTIKIAKA